MRLLTTAIALMTVMTAGAQNTPTAQMERLNRGLIALPAQTTGTFLSWRLLGTDDEERTRFDVLCNGKVVKSNLYETNCTYGNTNKTSQYQIVTKADGVPVDTTEAVTIWSNIYKKVVLDRPANSITKPYTTTINKETVSFPNGQTYSYTPNDCSVGDVDGDGQYELFVKWDPSNAKDNSQNGVTGIVYLDCYRLDGTKLWRIDLGRNIRAGAHYTQYMVYDFNGDGRAEMICKTGPGSKDGEGNYVSQAATDANIRGVDDKKDWTSEGAGRVIGGQEWLTVFDGLTGRALHTIFYNPNRNMSYGGAADGSVNWGVGKNDTGSYGNRGERYLAAVAHLDGPDHHPSAIFCRGYYDYAFIWAVDFNGQELHQRWLSSHKAENSYSLTTYDASGKGTTKSYSGLKPTSGSGSGTMYQNGNHNMSVADVDGDGCDEIVWGSAALDHNGRLLYGTGYGHGDAIHLADHCPDRPGLEVFQIHEGGNFGWDLHDAATGEILFSATGGKDNGRGIAGNFDTKTRGSLFWSSNDGSPRSAATGKTVYQSGGSSNFRIFWDGDLQEALLDGSVIDKFNSGNGGTTRLATLYEMGPGSTCNGTKNTPNLQADILGDWREEVILYSVTNEETCLGIYSSNITTRLRMPTLMHDHTYRMGIAWQNTAYNQPPHLGYYLPDAMKPRLLNDDRYDITAHVGDSLCYELQGRYTSSMLLSYVFLPDDSRVATANAPDGLSESAYNSTTKIFTLKGLLTMKGDYRFVLRVMGLDGTSFNDTIVVHAINDASGIEEQLMSQIHTSTTTAIYDAAGRKLPVISTATLPRGMYIIRKATSAGIATKKVFVE